MSPTVIAESVVTLAAIYVACGIVFALVFLAVGIGRLDPAADGSGYGFRALIFPGTVALWPMLALRWARGTSRPTERNAHRDAAGSEESR